jgi:hypothetical protein
MKLILITLVALVALVVGMMVACSYKPTPDIETIVNATIEAKLAQEQAIEATIIAGISGFDD